MNQSLYNGAYSTVVVSFSILHFFAFRRFSFIFFVRAEFLKNSQRMVVQERKKKNRTNLSFQIDLNVLFMLLFVNCLIDVLRFCIFLLLQLFFFFWKNRKKKSLRFVLNEIYLNKSQFNWFLFLMTIAFFCFSGVFFFSFWIFPSFISRGNVI